MTDIQTTFRGFAPDPRGGTRPPECVYEVEAVRRPPLWRIVWGWVRGTVILSMVLLGFVGMTSAIHGVIIPALPEGEARLLFVVFFILFFGLDKLTDGAPRQR